MSVKDSMAICFSFFFGIVTGRIISTDYNVVGWYDLRPSYVAAVPPDAIDFSAMTHLVVGGPTIADDGTVTCESYTNMSNVTAQLRRLATKHRVKMQWAIGSNFPARAINDSIVANNFVKTLRAVVEKCEVEGIEWDYEPGDAQTSREADAYTDFLAHLKTTLGPDFTISADIAAWTENPYISPSRMEGIDFVNLMSYFFDLEGHLDKYQDALDKIESWGFNASKINLGIPFYDSAQSTWSDISSSCPNIAPNLNSCSNTTFVGKTMNMRLGQLTQSRRLAGVFPWQLNYDTIHANNSLFHWLWHGLTRMPPLPPQPDRNIPHYLPITGNPYIYSSRNDANNACLAAGFSNGGLCSQTELVGFSKCSAGWLKDSEGYWMDASIQGCGHAGFNIWSGPAGAYCCNFSNLSMVK